MKTVWVRVNLRRGQSDPDGAQGVWEVALAADLPEGIAVGAALDTFHEHIGIEELDNYDIVVLEPRTQRVLGEDEAFDVLLVLSLLRLPL